MFRTIVWFIYFWLYLLVCIPASGFMRILEARGNMDAVYRHVHNFVRNWARRLVRLAGGQIEVVGQENAPEGAAVYISNHQGNFDVPIMLGYVGGVRGLIAKKELSHLPFIRTWMRHLHCIFVDRSSPRAGAQSILDGAKELESGHGLTIFPEGTRSRGGAMRSFKGGAFRIATKANAPIVPVTIDGSYRLMEANKGLCITPASVRVTIHPPIETAGMSREELKCLPERTQAIIAAALKDPMQRQIKD